MSTELHLTLDPATLVGLADHPGELAGYGPVPASLARELAAAARRWRALLVDPDTGQLRGICVIYRPRRLLDAFVRARDGSCCFPGCRQPAWRCDLDHSTPHSEGGGTCAGNLGPLCRVHHHAKTHADWTLDQPEPGMFLWTSPTGRIYTVRSPALVEVDLQPHLDSDPPPF